MRPSFSQASIVSAGKEVVISPQDSGVADRLVETLCKIELSGVCIEWAGSGFIRVDSYKEGEVSVEIYSAGIGGWILSRERAIKLFCCIAEGASLEDVSKFCQIHGCEPF